MRTDHRLLTFLILIVFLLILWSSLPSLRLTIRLLQQPADNKPKMPRPLKPKCEDDCPQCRAKKESPPQTQDVRPTPKPWIEVNSNRGRKKTIPTQGYACHNWKCPYYHILDENIHALVGYRSHGKNERIQDLMCQACGWKFTVRRDTVLYRLKTSSEKVAEVLSFMGAGVDVSTLEQVLGIGEGTLRTWQTRAGMHAKALHARFFQKLIFRHIQLDELWANVCNESQEVWLWAAIEATTKVVERINLTIRQGVAFLARRTWGTAQFSPELEISLEGWRGSYHFSRFHESLRVELAQPIQRQGKQLPRRYPSRTPAMAAGLTTHRWTVLELICYPLPGVG